MSVKHWSRNWRSSLFNVLATQSHHVSMTTSFINPRLMLYWIENKQISSSHYSEILEWRTSSKYKNRTLIQQFTHLYTENFFFFTYAHSNSFFLTCWNTFIFYIWFQSNKTNPVDVHPLIHVQVYMYLTRTSIFDAKEVCSPLLEANDLLCGQSD